MYFVIGRFYLIKMEIKLEIGKPNKDSEFAKLIKADPCVLTAELDLEDVLQLLIKDEKFSKFHNKEISPIRYEMKMTDKNKLIVTVNGHTP